MAVLKTVLVANKLRFTDVSVASIAPHLFALALEPSWLATVAHGQAEDPTYQRYITRAASANGEFCIRMVHGLPLLYRTPHGNTFQLIISANRGLCYLLMTELHCSSLVGYQGTRKTIATLQHRVWWPGLAKDICHFITGCLPYLCSKECTSLLPG